MTKTFFLDFSNIEKKVFYNTLLCMLESNAFNLEIKSFHFLGRDRGMLFLSNVLDDYICTSSIISDDGCNTLSYETRNIPDSSYNDKENEVLFLNKEAFSIEGRRNPKEFIKNTAINFDYILIGRETLHKKHIPKVKNIGFVSFVEGHNKYLLISVKKLEAMFTVFEEIDYASFFELIFDYLSLFGCLFLDATDDCFYQVRSKQEILMSLGIPLPLREYQAQHVAKECSYKDEGICFGILNNGENESRVTRLIESIEHMMAGTGIPYEVVIAGPSSFGIAGVKLLDGCCYESKDVRGWITRKKNQLAMSSIYENVFLLHDRIVFPDNFTFNARSFPVTVYPVRAIDNRAYRVNDWESFVNGDYFDLKRFRLTPMLYSTHSDSPMVYGGAFLIRKEVLIKYQFDERLFWGESEDIIQSVIYSRLGVQVGLDSNNYLLTDRARLGGYKSNMFSFLTVKCIRYFLTPKNKFFIKKVINYVSRCH